MPLKHGMSNTPEYRAWVAMWNRCTNQNYYLFKDYGGRGISVCDQWKTFSGFFADMGPRPDADHSLDRIDVNGNYGPGNCRWATWTEQQRNRRNTVHHTFRGVTATLKELCEMEGAILGTARSRIACGASIEIALQRGRIPRGTIKKQMESRQ